MTFYATQVLKMEKAIYPKKHLTRQLIQSKHFIDQHFGKPLQLDQIAAEGFLSKFYFVRLFKSLYGCSPYQYLIWVRIENAKQLLGAGFSLSDVCTAVGFESVTSFIGLFKKMTGYTPASYQKKNSNLREPGFRKN